MEALARAFAKNVKKSDPQRKAKKKNKKNKKSQDQSATQPVDLATLEAQKRKKRREREKRKKQNKRKRAKAEQEDPATTAPAKKSTATSSKTGLKTVSIALPGSIVDNCQSRELQSYVAGTFFFGSSSSQFLLLCTCLNESGRHV